MAMPMLTTAASAVSSPALYNNHPNNLGRPHQQEAAAVSLFCPPKLSLLRTVSQYSVCRRAPRNVNAWKRRIWIRSELTMSLETSTGPSFADRGKDLHEIPRSRPLMAASPAVVSPVALPSKMSKKSVCLFFCEEMRELAERVASAGDSIELRSITWRCDCFYSLAKLTLSNVINFLWIFKFLLFWEFEVLITERSQCQQEFIQIM